MREDRITSIFSFVAAVAAATVGVSHFMMPREQLHLATGVTQAFFESLGQDSGAFRIHYWSFVVASLAFAAVVSAAGNWSPPRGRCFIVLPECGVLSV